MKITNKQSFWVATFLMAGMAIGVGSTFAHAQSASYSESSQCMCGSGSPEELKKCVDACKEHGSMTLVDVNGQSVTIKLENTDAGFASGGACTSDSQCNQNQGLTCQNGVCRPTD